MINWDRKRQHLVILLEQTGTQCEILFENPSMSENIALICHPHPLHQGTMYNKVTAAIAKGFNDAQIATFRFNFPGVGQSTGQFDDGRGEAQITQALLDLIKKEFRPQNTFLSGFSFGGAIAHNIEDPSLIAKVLIAPAWRLITDKCLTHRTMILHSLDDPIVPAEPTVQLLQDTENTHNLKAVITSSSGHFYEGELDEVREQVKLYSSCILKNNAKQDNCHPQDNAAVND